MSEERFPWLLEEQAEIGPPTRRGRTVWPLKNEFFGIPEKEDKPEELAQSKQGLADRALSYWANLNQEERGMEILSLLMPAGKAPRAGVKASRFAGKKGVELAELWRQAVVSGRVDEAPPLYRIVKKSRALDPRMPMGAQIFGEPAGRYYGFTPKEAIALRDAYPHVLRLREPDAVYAATESQRAPLSMLAGNPISRSEYRAAHAQKITKSYPLERSGVLDVKDMDHWQELVRHAHKMDPTGSIPPAERITRALRQMDYDFVILPDFLGGLSNIPQVVQLTPKKVRTKLGSKIEIMGIGGAASAAAVGSQIERRKGPTIQAD